ncbi:BsuPI-related putative proteinase inhibitor [Bacillus sp. CGMCC 1.16607]|uniref:BsuPI-related putative proteinase inhibitor n=1 Tax=Bacillus sp. CGMCC 1.16607 TaxID=3351842 RepID=UPI0036351A02
MKIKSKLSNILSTLIILFTLTACGTTNIDKDEKNKVVNGSSPTTEDKKPAGIVAGKLTSSLENNSQNGNFSFIFSIKNEKEKEDILKYSSTQQYDYSLKDSTGMVVYTYSMDKIFAQQMSETTLKQGEIISMEIDLTESLNQLNPGTYQLEVWSTAIDQPNLRENTEINWGGIGEGMEEDGKLKGFPVTFIGLMDNNSIEVLNEEGNPEHYRLSEKVKPDIALFKKDDKITIYYKTIDGQKVIEQATKD